MSVEDSESRRFELNIWVSFYPADLGPTSAQECFFSGFLERLKILFGRVVPIASGTEILWRVSLKFKLFLKTSRSQVGINITEVTKPSLNFQTACDIQ